MKRIIITEKTGDQIAGNDIILINPKDFIAPVPMEWANYSVEYIPFLINTDVISLGKSKPVVMVDFLIPNSQKYLIAAQILSTTDAALHFFSENGDESLRFENDNGLFRNMAINLYSKSEMEIIISSDENSQRVSDRFENDFNYELFKDLFQSSINHDRHQAINEWAAIKILLNYPKTLREIEINFKFPRTIFFRQKLKEFGISEISRINTSSSRYSTELAAQKAILTRKHRSIAKILLIDDNAERGWKYVLSTLFPNSVVEVKKSLQEANSITDFSLYDLIFLDLKLPTNATDVEPKIENGLKLIDKIKGSGQSLHIPLLVLTASQKASTMYECQQRGADDIYVKEDPSFSLEQSTLSYLEFIKKINVQIKKAEDLKKYWTAMIEIKTNFLPQIVDDGVQLLKSRIIERLEMFYGLLKKNHEQSSFNDSKFHFSAEILSFITLWSILNEIQECYYQKGTGISSTLVQNTGSRRSSSPVPLNLDDWKIKAQIPAKYFIVEKPIFEEKINNLGVRQQPKISDYFRKELYSNLIFQKNPPYFAIDTTGYKKATGNLKQKLFLQIGFLLLNKDDLRLSSRISDYLKILKESNDERNKLYITHGEGLSSNFHSSTEKDKAITTARILNLFKLVAFLLTGKDSLI